QRILQRLHHARTVAPLLHVDQVEYDDAAQIAQSDLPRDLFDRFHVRARDRVFEPRAAAPDELTRVHVNCDERLGLIDDEIAAGLQPHARLDRFINLSLHAVSFKDRLFARVQLDAIDEARLNAVYELDDLLILLFVVHADRCEVVRELIAQETLYKIEVFVRHRRRFLLLGDAAYVLPSTDEITRVVAQVLFADADACGADDEAARRHFLSLAYVFDELAQALPLTVRLDLARDADVFDGRHIDKEATGQSDVRSDARAFGRNRLFGDLHEYLLPLAQEVCDHRRAAITAASAPCVAASALASSAVAAHDIATFIATFTATDTTTTAVSVRTFTAANMTAPARAASAVSATTATAARRRRRFLDVRRFRWRNRFLDRFRMPVAVLLRAVLARLGPAIASPAAAPRKLAARGRDLHARICVGERFVGACAAFGRARRIRLFGRGLAALRCASFASRALRCRLLACFLARALSRARALAFRRGLFCRVSFGRGTLLALHAAACARRLAFGRGQSF